MATRCNIRITAPKSSLWLYRHWDGYAACTGSDIARTLKHLRKGYARTHGSFSALANALLAKRYDKRPHDEEARPIYEITTDRHGDIEWLYEIKCGASDRVTITVTEIRHDVGEKVHGMMTEAQFRSFVAKEVWDMLKRIRARRRERRAA